LTPPHPSSPARYRCLANSDEGFPQYNISNTGAMMNIKNMLTSFWETVSLIVLLSLMASLMLYIIGVLTQAILMIVMGLPLAIFSLLIGTNIVPWFLSPAPVPLHYEFLFFVGFGFIGILLIALIVCGCVLYARRKEIMKRGLGIFLAFMIIAVIPAAAWARERSCLFSEKDLATIEAVTKKAYPAGVKIEMVVDEDLLGRYTVIEFWKASDDTLSLRFEVNAFGVRMSDAESEKIVEKVGGQVIEIIEKILNERPRTALGSIIE
jgi:hypothetical protein